MRVFLTLLIVFLAAPQVHARFAVRPKMVPMHQLLQNLQIQFNRNPNDAHAHYVKGRLHSMAYAGRTERVEVAEPFREPKNPLVPDFAPYRSIMVRSPKNPKIKLNFAHVLHLQAAFEHYQKALKLNPKDTKTRLGLAWMYETGRSDAEAIKAIAANAKDLPGKEKALLKTLAAGVDQWEANALKHYRQVLKEVGPADLKRRMHGPQADSVISLDAARALQRILGAEGRQTTAEEKAELAAVDAHLKLVAKFPRVVTPVIFPLDRNRPLKDLLSGRTTTFDLDGDGLTSRWPWVKPATGILVWDPKRTGRIADGRQLFGSVTWWIFWNNGFEPMALLDDNHDGWLAGSELKDLGVWQDRNSNGVSDPGEVQPLSAHGIARLATQPQEGLTHPTGLELNDGQRLPVYDWKPTSLPARD
jgi:hypothetical protein